jgi:hypothetical protein
MSTKSNARVFLFYQQQQQVPLDHAGKDLNPRPRFSVTQSVQLTHAISNSLRDLHLQIREMTRDPQGITQLLQCDVKTHSTNLEVSQDPQLYIMSGGLESWGEAYPSQLRCTPFCVPSNAL